MYYLDQINNESRYTMHMNILDPVNAVLGAMATILVIKDHKSGWYFYLATNLTSFMMYIQAGLYYFSLIKLVFFTLTIYGLKELIIGAQNKKQLSFLPNIFILILISLISITSSDPKLELPLIVISLIAYYLTAAKYYNAFFYWIIYDILLIKMCIHTGLYWNLAKHFCYLLIGLWGLGKWYRQTKLTTLESSTNISSPTN